MVVCNKMSMIKLNEDKPTGDANFCTHMYIHVAKYKPPHA